MSEYSQVQVAYSCPRDPKHHHYAIRTTEIINGKTIITKECAACGQFISQTVLPVERRTAQ